ncbi:alpha/beta fold hydrolase [Sphingomonas phyllosphaerae]|uniref:alpha/beta fold hydrolase n=1 Tax=Sphingomonas phyllosphaerae TaxID=257003 RepID=UPI0004912E70|nr:alpha/beta hydrolase [Sphingomonas phyllosphaerae]
MKEVLVAANQLAGRLIPCGRDGAPLLLCLHGGGCNGRYFHLPGFSVAERAVQQGFDVLLVDRPGHGLSVPGGSACPIVEAAGLLTGLLEAMMPRRSSSEMVLLGHSIGGAVALTFAAASRLRISAIAVSGIGRSPTEAALSWLADFKADRDRVPPIDFFFGPRGTYDWRAPIALRSAAETWHLDEVCEVLLAWPRRFDAIAARLTMPISISLSEHEKIWDLAELASGKFAAQFGNTSHMTSDVLPAGGHLYELHSNGPQMVQAQLAFLIAACGR